jgi:hypothetical protein
LFVVPLHAQTLRSENIRAKEEAKLAVNSLFDDEMNVELAQAHGPCWYPWPHLSSAANHTP